MFLYVYAEATTRSELDKEFGTDERNFQEKIVGSAKWNRYFEYYPGKPKPKTLKEFKEFLLKEQNSFVEEFRQRGLQVKPYVGPAPFFFWLSDSRDTRDTSNAIFVFVHFDPKEPSNLKSVAFKTSDQRFIQLLRTIFARFATP